MLSYKLRFDPERIKELADLYTFRQSDADRKAEAHIENVIAPTATKNGYYSRDHFIELCRWKTPRSQRLCAANDAAYIYEVTSLALRAKTDRLRIEIPTLLYGVGWPTASVLLHFGHLDHYPILDFRALWSLTIPEPRGEYNFAFWWDYVQACRKVSQVSQVSMRILDRALWQFSADNQPAK